MSTAALLLEGPAGSSVGGGGGGRVDSQTPPANMNDPLSWWAPNSLYSCLGKEVVHQTGELLWGILRLDGILSAVFSLQQLFLRLNSTRSLVTA